MSRCGCFYCIFYLLIISFVIGGFIFWIIFLPQNLKFSVTDASLTKFEYVPVPNDTLFYSLALNITVRNPNKRVGFYVRRIKLIPRYRKKQLFSVTLNSAKPYYQGYKNSTFFSTKIEGQQMLFFNEKDRRQYDLETGLGVYNFNVEFAIRVKIRYGSIKSRPENTNDINCRLKIPLSNSNGTALLNNGNRFKATGCSYPKAKYYY